MTNNEKRLLNAD